MSTAPRVWLPYPAEEIGGLPDGPHYQTVADIEVTDGASVLPDDPTGVEFFALPYLREHSAARLLSRMPDLRVAQTLTAGVDAVSRHVPDTVTLCNARGVHDASTAELACTLTLASLRGVPRFVRDQDAGLWNRAFYPALADRRVLLVGYGAVGEAIEARLRPFEVDVDRVARTARETASGPVHAFTDLPRLLPEADVVILAVPLTEDTRQLVDATFLSRMRDGALLVNVARGPVVDTEALVAELETSRLHAACDVTDPEPLPTDHPLWYAPNTLISPHVGGASSAFEPRAQRLIRSQLHQWVAGDPLDNVMRSA